jgi:hypothetical protein
LTGEVFAPWTSTLRSKVRLPRIVVGTLGRSALRLAAKGARVAAGRTVHPLARAVLSRIAERTAK